MKLHRLRVAGFARLTDCTYDFAPGLNVVFGPNESGKSTLANAIVATLYGVERKKEAWRPWNGAAYATTLVYECANGEQIEVQRDFDRDSKGLRIYDRSGNDIAAKLGQKKLVPGEAHLGIPLEVFLNAACVKQQAIAIDEGKDAGQIASHLARALDGGPREDAALGAIKRLDDALRTHVGTERARKNAPLRALRAQADAQRATGDEARASLLALDELRARIERAAHDRDRFAGASVEIDRRTRSMRATAITKRLANLREFREELAELQAAHAVFDDVATFAAEREGEINDAFYACEFADRTAAAALSDEAAAQLTPDELAELDARRSDGGAVDDDTFAALTAASMTAEAARLRASAAANEAAAARRTGEGGKSALGVALAIGVFALCIAIGFAIAHDWVWTGVALAVAVALLGVAFAQGNGRARRRGAGERKQKLADDALAVERSAATAVAAVLDPLGVPNVEELTRRRERYAALLAREEHAARAAVRAEAAREDAARAAANFDALALLLVPDVARDRTTRKAAVNARAARKRERDGLDAHLNALEMRKSTILGSEDEFALETELAELHRDGVELAMDEPPQALRLIEAERAEIGEQRRIAGETFSRLQGELTSAESHVTDLAALDEALARTNADIAHLEAFERAVKLAKQTIEMRTQEAHQAFARRLEDYAAATLHTITAGRYTQIFIDPTTLQINVRVPETQAIVDLDTLSAGTRDQAYLVVRFAMARMFAEGLEMPPLLLDDPFAYWDAARIERCLPLIEQHARDAQVVLFTSSVELATAAVAHGARRIDLGQPALI